jgi:hypothetical protein
LRIKRGRQQRRVAMRLPVGQGLGRKSSGPCRIVTIGPGPGQRDGQPRPLLPLRQRVRLVQARRHPARNSAECLRGSQSQRGLGHRLNIAGHPGSFVAAHITSAGGGRGAIGQPRLPGQTPANPPHHLMIGPSVLVNCRSNDTGDVARHSVMQNVTPLGMSTLHFAQPRRKVRARYHRQPLQGGTRMRRILFTPARLAPCVSQSAANENGPNPSTRTPGSSQTRTTEDLKFSLRFADPASEVGSD